MKPILYTLVLCVFFGSCATYSVKSELDERASLKEAKKLGVIVRVPHKNRISRDDILSSLSRSLNGYEQTVKIEIIPDLSPGCIEFTDDEERFYQVSSDQEFLKYKSIGILRTYLRDNGDEIRKAIEKNSLDGIVIYEMYGIISIEMQMMHFDSVVIVVDKNLNQGYLDHQNNSYNSIENDYNALRSEILTHMATRFVEAMKFLGYVKDFK
jgi:hypothetical protein